MINLNKLTENLNLLSSKETEYLSKQRDIIDRPNKEVGICCLTSLFNAYPRLFKYNVKNISKELEELKSEQYKAVDDVISHINNKYNMFHGDILHKVKLQSLDYKHNVIIESIEDKLPIVFFVNFKNRNLGSGHAITILGYKDNDYYAFENANDNPILNDIAMSKTFDMIQSKLKPENIIQRNILLNFVKNINNNALKVKYILELQNQIIKDDTIFVNYDKFFKFNGKFLLNWYDVLNTGLIVINKNIREIADEEIEYSIKDIICNTDDTRLLNFAIDNASVILNRKLDRLENELNIDREELINYIF